MDFIKSSLKHTCGKNNKGDAHSVIACLEMKIACKGMHKLTKAYTTID